MTNDLVDSDMRDGKEKKVKEKEKIGERAKIGE